MKKFDFSRQWEQIQNTPGVLRDTIALVAIVVAGVVGISLVITSLGGALPFESRTIVKAEFSQATGLNPLSQPAVTIAGVEAGYVEDAETTARGTALVTLNVEGGHPVYENARAMMRPKNPLNDQQVELNPGAPPAAPMPEEGVIPESRTQRPTQSDEILNKIDERTQTALTSLLTEADTALVQAPEQLPGGLAGTSDTMVKLRPVVDQLKTRRGQIAELVTALSQISTAAGKNDQRTARLADATQQTLGVLARNDGALRASLEQMPGLSDDLRTALTSTQRLTTQLDPTLDNLKAASNELPPALESFQGTVQEVGKTVDAAAPVIQEAKPVVADLKPLVADVNESLEDLLPVTKRLDRDTRVVTSYLTEIRSFFYNTRSVFGAGDAQGGIIRGHVVFPNGLFGQPQQPGIAPGPENGQPQDQKGSRIGPDPGPGGLPNLGDPRTTPDLGDPGNNPVGGTR